MNFFKLCLFLFLASFNACSYHGTAPKNTTLPKDENEVLRSKIRRVANEKVKFAFAETAVGEPAWLNSAKIPKEKKSPLYYNDVMDTLYNTSTKYEDLFNAMGKSEYLGWVLPHNEKDTWGVAGVIWELNGMSSYFEIWYLVP